MLTRLHIRDFAIVPFLEQEFRAGFTAISGETGAGKSILVDALSLLLGARGDSAWIRSGSDKAELSAEFDLSGNEEARAWLRELELEADDACLLRRVIRANGRSSAWINGSPVTITQLGELGDLLVEVHGQNEHVRLRGRRRQLEMLDATGDHDAALEETAAAHAHWRELSSRLEALEREAALPPAEADFLRHQLGELDRHALPPEALAELEQEHRLLAGAGELLATLDRAVACVDDEQEGAVDRLSRAVTSLERFDDLDPAVAEARAMLGEALINCQEAVRTLQGAGDRIELNPERLRAVERTLSDLGDLARKHGVAMEKLSAVRDGIRERLERAEQSEELRTQLRRERDAALDSYRDAAGALSAARREHAEALSARVEKAMGELGMAGGRFVIHFESDPEGAPTPLGDDRVELLVSANPGMPPGPLSKVASGGELSRISLAIKVVTAGGDGRTQVFDEVDTGVGGDTANAVGRLLRAAAAGGQALCVTHLAQVAARADQQLRVVKESDTGHTRVDARVLEQDARLDEIARMLGGKVSDQGRAHAAELLSAAKDP